MRNNKKINIGIVGCGAHSQIAHIPFFNKNPRGKIIALCDSDLRKIDYLSTKYNIPYKYHDFQQILENEEINVLVIATPNYLHAPMTISALKYGKDVLCETPMSIDLKEAEEVVDTVKQTGKKLALAMNNRLRTDVEIIKKFIQNGELGDIYYIKTGWLIGSQEWILKPWRLERLKSGGGVFLNLGYTLLDIALYLIGKKTISSIYGSLHKKEAQTEVEDTALCIINFKDNTLLTIEVGWSLIFEHDFLYCNIFGKKGAALLNPLQIKKELHNELFNVTPSLEHKSLFKKSYEQQVEKFIDFLYDMYAPPLSLEDGLLIARVIDAFYQSAHQGKLITI